MKCLNCNNTKFYKLQNFYIKCTKCNKKISLKKLKKEKKVLSLFCENKTALEASSELKVNYRTIKNRYNKYRFEIAKYLQNKYNDIYKKNIDYEEYFYFTNKQNSKNNKLNSNAISIIGFYSQDCVYTLLLPKLNFMNKNFTNLHKISSKESYKTKLNKFWKYLEKNLSKYKGVKEEMFFYYLKEYEFKFNNDTIKQKEILNKIIIEEGKINESIYL